MVGGCLVGVRVIALAPRAEVLENTVILWNKYIYNLLLCLVLACFFIFSVLFTGRELNLKLLYIQGSLGIIGNVN